MRQPRPLERGAVDLVSYLFEPVDAEAAPASEAPQGEPRPLTLEEVEQRRDRLRGLGVDIEIETLPDLDVIILRGRTRDVEDVTRIIEEIERLSEATQPVMEIYRLLHAPGIAVVDIIDQIAEDLVGGRQGRVSVTPLVKPNALLLIGWGEAIAAVKELIAKLDQPVGPNTQLRVFRLQHASAATVGAAAQEFYGGRTGLGPSVIVTVDERSNSLVVQASPRDLAEVLLLIESLDAPMPAQ